ncbi:histidine phosphatase family protein [Candidatus Nomurabacteria bacterium]|nr:histidine phosphatase family protein [Candidatus Nomurabacteria bacterium]
MKIYFIRHPKTQNNKERLFSGQLDLLPLEEGLEEARRMAHEIPADFTLIYSSDFIRCKQMVEILNEQLRLPVIYDPRLKERKFGSLEGESMDVMNGLNFEEKNKLIIAHGGESFVEFGKRIFDCIEYMKENNPNDKILVVTSGGVIRLLYKKLKNISFEAGQIPNSSIHEFEF